MVYTPKLEQVSLALKKVNSYTPKLGHVSSLVTIGKLYWLFGCLKGVFVSRKSVVAPEWAMVPGNDVTRREAL